MFCGIGVLIAIKNFVARDSHGVHRKVNVGEMIRDDDPIVTGREVLFDTQTLDDSAFDSGGSPPTTRAQYDLALADVPTNTPTKLPFVFNYGTELLDLTDTTDPTPVESGIYSFAVTVAISDVVEDGTWGIVVTLDEDDFAGTMAASDEITAVTGVQTVTFPFYVPAGSPCFVKVTHSDTDGADFSGHVYLQRLS